jgi:hypothetical protein
MRSFSLWLIVLFLALGTCAQAQPRELTFAEYRQKIEAPPSVVEDTATALAEKNQLLRGIALPQGIRPPALVPGSVLLSFDGAPFTLYLRSINHHTEAVLESQKLQLSEETRRKAQQFLQQIANRASTKNG